MEISLSQLKVFLPGRDGAENSWFFGGEYNEEVYGLSMGFKKKIGATGFCCQRASFLVSFIRE